MSSTVRVKVNKLKWPKRVTMRVGILQDTQHNTPDGESISIMGLAETHEFGLGTAFERSFIRAGYDVLHEEIEAIALQQMQIDPVLGAERTAVKAAAMFRNRMSDGLEPDLTEQTKQRKEKRNIHPPYKPLIETGVLKSAIAGDAEVVW